MLVTDPPYGMKYQGFGRKQPAIQGDDSTKARDQLLETWGDKPALVFGTWRVPRPQCRNTIAWIKPNVGPGMGPIDLPWGTAWEEIYVIGRGFAAPKRGPNYTIHHGLTSSSKARPKHPTTKPIPLMEWLVGYCPPSWVIVDPFAGSGATLRAANNFGRRAIGFEINHGYYQEAVQLLRKDMECPQLSTHGQTTW